MNRGLPRSLRRGQNRSTQPATAKIVLAVNSSMVVDGATTPGDGQIVIGGLPEGNLLILGAVAYMQFAAGGAEAGLVDSWEGDYSIGTTPDAGDDLTGTDADIVAITALAAATVEVSPRTRGVGNAPAVIDNTDGSAELNLNLLVDDADISADGIPMTVVGELFLIYTVLGDD